MWWAVWNGVVEFKPSSLNNIPNWEWFDRLRYENYPALPIVGENPMHRENNSAWHMENIKATFPHSRRHRAMRAICKDDMQELKKVLDEGFDVDAVVDLKDGKSGLALAAQLERPLIAHYLLLRGASAQKKDLLGNTPVMYAVERANFETLKELVDHGADPKVLNN